MEKVVKNVVNKLTQITKFGNISKYKTRKEAYSKCL